VFSDDERGEEVLRAGGWSRRTAGAIAVAGLVVALGLAVGLTHGGGGTPGAETSAPAPESSRVVVFYPPTMTGNDAIDVGSWTAEQTRAGARGAPEWFAIASAGLVNYANRAFLIDYPITVTGDGVGQAITVDVAMVGLDETGGNASSIRPRGLTTIRPLENVELWVKLRLPCVTPSPHRSPIHNLRISISLEGTTAPATFTFRQLFGLRGAPRQPPTC
jgi:hypothetical protein